MKIALKWSLGCVAALVILFFAYAAFMVFVSNPKIIEELRTQPHGERAKKVMLLTFTSGKTIPVNYLEKNGKVYIGADGPWWRQFTDDGATVTLLIRGNRLSGHARTILDNPAHVEDIFSRLRPTVPEWLPEWLNGKLVEVVPSQS